MEVAMDKTTILVVDDSVTIRAMIEVLLERDPSLEIVGVAREDNETSSLIKETDPDVVTLDIAMPGMNGMELLDKLMKTQPRPVIMLSSMMREGSDLAATAMEHGAAGCFNKNHIVRDADTLIAMIKEVAFQRTHRLSQVAVQPRSAE
jgi:chemotaxis response regulator CheB